MDGSFFHQADNKGSGSYVYVLRTRTMFSFID